MLAAPNRRSCPCRASRLPCLLTYASGCGTALACATGKRTDAQARTAADSKKRIMGRASSGLDRAGGQTVDEESLECQEADHHGQADDERGGHHLVPVDLCLVG